MRSFLSNVLGLKNSSLRRLSQPFSKVRGDRLIMFCVTMAFERCLVSKFFDNDESSRVTDVLEEVITQCSFLFSSVLNEFKDKRPCLFHAFWFHFESHNDVYRLGHQRYV